MQAQNKIVTRAAQLIAVTLPLIHNEQQRQRQAKALETLFTRLIRHPDAAISDRDMPEGDGEGKSQAARLVVRIHSSDGLALLENRHTPLATTVVEAPRI